MKKTIPFPVVWLDHNDNVVLRTPAGEYRFGKKRLLAVDLARAHAHIYGYPQITLQKGLIKR